MPEVDAQAPSLSFSGVITVHSSIHVGVSRNLFQIVHETKSESRRRAKSVPETALLQRKQRPYGGIDTQI